MFHNLESRSGRKMFRNCNVGRGFKLVYSGNKVLISFTVPAVEPRRKKTGLRGVSDHV